MRESENLYDKLKELMGNTPGKLSIMEDIVDVDLQVEYFEFSKKVSQEYDASWALDQAELLTDPDYPDAEKKRLLARLATIEEVKAFRYIESFAEEAPPSLKDWSLMALQESRMHLESHLLEENQVFISTGLGGKEDKLRYFVVLIARNREEFSEFQIEIIEKEFAYALKPFDVEVEEFNASGYLATFLLLLPIQHSVKEVFTRGIEECNQYGDFLRDNCIVTNVKKLSFGEIMDFIERKKSDD